MEYSIDHKVSITENPPTSQEEVNRQMLVIVREWMEYSIDHKVSITENPTNTESVYNREH
jgi:hypothetical protein